MHGAGSVRKIAYKMFHKHGSHLMYNKFQGPMGQTGAGATQKAPGQSVDQGQSKRTTAPLNYCNHCGRLADDQTSGRKTAIILQVAKKRSAAAGRHSTGLLLPRQVLPRQIPDAEISRHSQQNLHNPTCASDASGRGVLLVLVLVGMAPAAGNAAASADPSVKMCCSAAAFYSELNL